MSRKDETPLEPIEKGHGQTFEEADNYRLSDVEREAVRQGIDAVKRKAGTKQQCFLWR